VNPEYDLKLLITFKGLYMQKIVINKNYCGFCLSEDVKKRLNIVSSLDIERDDPRLIQIVEELGEDAAGYGAMLKIVEIPDDVDWEINEDDGSEWIAEKHRTWC